MKHLSKLPGLQIDSTLITEKSANLIPPRWPPPKDFPVVINARGEVVSRYGDACWKLGPWAGTAKQISFGDGDGTRGGAKINRPNAELFRAVTGWWLWGPNAVRTPATLISRHECMKSIFVGCSNAGILASDLYRYPRVIEDIATSIAPSHSDRALWCLYQIWLERGPLGFTILDDAALKQFSSLIQERNSIQTAYIPPRIWTYQVIRLRECLDDYIRHRDQLEACFRFCLNAYAHNAAGSFAKSSNSKLLNARAPFHPNNEGRKDGSRLFYGAFRHTAEHFGIASLLSRWVNTSDQAGIKALSSFLSLTSRVGMVYALNFSLMRADEGYSLRANCFEVERDSLGEDIHLLKGVTTKTIEDSDACWIVSPSVNVAVEAMRSVATLRVEAARLNPHADLSVDDLSNPRMQMRAYEPWGASLHVHEARKRRSSYGQLLISWPKLFNLNELRITEEDLSVARRMTLGLDPGHFAVGKVWPLAFHQIRRTGAVNMLSSGLVSDASVQYQLKHAARAMTRYYGQNHYRLKSAVNDDTCGFYVREMHQSIAREYERLSEDRFISPHGEKRKEQILRPISEFDHLKLLKYAEEGRISYRATFLGGCGKTGEPCNLGGITNITGCMGSGKEKPCHDALLDRSKRPIINELKKIAADKHKTAEPGSPLSKSLEAQIESLERALNAIDSA